MPAVTFQVLEGIDKGRIFRELATPVTLGREEGNIVRLNDERVSRYHAKVQYDNGEIILTDLESTNGTRVNGTVVQIRRLRPGDRIGIGRSLLLFGSEAEIAQRMATLNSLRSSTLSGGTVQATMHAPTMAQAFDHDADFELGTSDKLTVHEGTLFAGNRPLPPLPQKLTPSQAARLAEMLDFLHRQLAVATEKLKATEDGEQITLPFADWQRIQAVEMVLARYVRAIAEPEALEQ
jgi:pSer/pThr/pTyr-binding forkhead associated (FHA) protein